MIEQGDFFWLSHGIVDIKLNLLEDLARRVVSESIDFTITSLDQTMSKATLDFNRLVAWQIYVLRIDLLKLADGRKVKEFSLLYLSLLFIRILFFIFHQLSGASEILIHLSALNM